MPHTKICGNRPTGSGERDFEGFLPCIYERGGHLGHVTSNMSSDFHFLVLPESFHKNLVQISTVISEKIQFEFLY